MIDVHALHRLGRAANPDIEVPIDAFAFQVERAGNVQARKHVADLYLACGCLHGDEAALRTFEVKIVARLPRAIARFDHSPMFVTEIQQRVRQRMLMPDGERPARIAGYAARGTLIGFVRRAAIHEALMERRTVRRRRLAPLQDVAIEDDLIELIGERDNQIVREALHGALAALDGRERAALRLSYLLDLSVDQIGATYQVHRATAARWVARARSRVRELTHRTTRDRLELSETETNALLSKLASDDLLSSTIRASLAA